MSKLNTQAVENLFNQWKDAQNFSGVISVSKEEGIIYEKVQGFRNRGEQLPNELDTAFGIASGTKLFTAVAICRLIDQGKLALESKIEDILPHDLGNIDKDVTIFHLLTHSSGIRDYYNEIDFDEFFEKYPTHKWTNAFFLTFFNHLPSKFKAGTKALYSNSNFILLGLIIEAVSGQSYHAYIEEQIIQPLNLTKTGFYRADQLPSNTALGYVYDEKLEEIVANTFYLPLIGTADGGLYTTTNDMEIFWKAVWGRQLFSKEMLKKFLTVHAQDQDDKVQYGLGVFIDEKEGEFIYWHSGSDYGVSFHTAYIPKTGNVLTILSNEEKNIWDFQDKLMSLLI